MRALRPEVMSSMKSGARVGGALRSRSRVALLACQAALSVVLLVGAGLFVRSLANIQSLRLGYDADKIVWIEPRMRGVRLDSAQAVALRHDLMNAARRSPAVENATGVLTVPFSSTWSDDAYAAGADSTRKLTDVINQMASTTFFATVGTRIVRGRGITADDRNGGALVAVVSETMARDAWPNQEAIGKCVRMSADTNPCRTVVGIAEDIKLSDFNGPSYPMVYLPSEQVGENQGSLYIRVRGDAHLQAESLRRELQTLMPGAAYLTAVPLSNLVEQNTRSWRLGAAMFAVFGGLALLIAAIGLYSVIAYGVAQRTHEMGVRIALGARVADVVTLVVRDGMRVVIAGVAIGLAAALLGGKWLQPLLFDVSPRDPVVYSIVAAVLIGVAIAASWIPAQRAARVDPSTALRGE
jgi:predicted permease